MKTNPDHPETPAEEKAEERLSSRALFEDRVTFDFELEARPQPTDDYYARNCKDAIPVTIRATTRVAAEKLALDAIGPCIRGHRWEFRLLRFHSSNR